MKGWWTKEWNKFQEFGASGCFQDSGGILLYKLEQKINVKENTHHHIDKH